MRGSSPLRRLSRFEESRFWCQLELAGRNAGDARVDRLKASVRTVAERAALISAQVGRFLPHFTLHDERHLLNVLAIMDALVPEETLGQLTPLECALPILAAYVHDLGLALPHEEWQRLYDSGGDPPERRRFLRHREGYVHELRQIERWRRQGGADAERRIALIEGFLLAEHVRRSHADARGERIRRWLDAMEEETGSADLFRYGGESFKHKLVLVATSHGQEAPWLRERLVELAAGRGGGFCQLAGMGEWVNWGLPALLLRLADIMDFDASRAPRILYQHVGIENETSILEWQKHLSIVGWDLRPAGRESRLTYRAECSHPVFEKTIRDFGAQIEAELKSVGLELEEERRWLEPEQRFELHLPSRVDLEVHARIGPDGPLYVYEDLRLELDQSEIQSLLMGEALYGDPVLCLRELAQNALDAVELRDLRLRLQAAQSELPPSRREGVAADPPPPGRELAVRVAWDRDEASGEEWIRVRDDGVGMTRHVLGAYFTQVGRSFYRSPELARERALMARHGLRLSSISSFGIGFLSCFMIADRVVVRTHPGHGAGERPLDITLLGPESLLWLRPGSLEEQGTEVTLYLRPEHRLAAGDAGGSGLDPAELLRRSVVWPRHPLVLEPTGERIDGRGLPPGLAEDDPRRWLEKAEGWGVDDAGSTSVGWGRWQWRDERGEAATGSRLRLLFPSPAAGGGEPDLPADGGDWRQDTLGALAEADLSRRLDERGRTLVLVKGIRVPGDEPCRQRLGVRHGPGTLVLVDLHGEASPPLTADRQSVVESAVTGDWREAFDALFERFYAALAEAVAGRADVVRNLLAGFRWPAAERWLRPAAGGERRLELLTAAGVPSPRAERLAWTLGRWLQDLTFLPAPGSSARGLEVLAELEDDPGLDPQLGGRWRSFAGHRKEARALDPVFAREARLPLVPLAAHRLAPRLGADLARLLAHRPQSEVWADVLEPCRVGWWLRQALEPRLERSSPVFGVADLRGRLDDGRLAAPAVVRWLLESDGRTVVPAPGGALSGALAGEGYDLVFPLGAPGLPSGAEAVGAEHEARWRTLLAAAPFLHPEAHDLWARHAVELIGLFSEDELYALLPAPELWSKPFSRWSTEERSSRCLSALWSLETGVVLWAVGRRDVEETRRLGRPFPMLSGSSQRARVPAS